MNFEVLGGRSVKKLPLVFLRAFLAGIMISIGGVVYLSSPIPLAGSLLFAVGLYAILTQGYALYTGAVGYALTAGKQGLLELPVIWLGNLAGTFVCGEIVRLARISETVCTKAASLADVKLNDSLLSIFLLSIFCGMLMFLAVDTFKTQEQGILKAIPVFVCVSVFITCGFEHCVANMFYFAAARSFLIGKTWLYLIVMTLGNAVGGIALGAGKLLIFGKPNKNQ